MRPGRATPAAASSSPAAARPGRRLLAAAGPGRPRRRPAPPVASNGHRQPGSASRCRAQAVCAAARAPARSPWGPAGPLSANRNSRWLFPGRRAGQPMHSDALRCTPVRSRRWSMTSASPPSPAGPPPPARRGCLGRRALPMRTQVVMACRDDFGSISLAGWHPRAQHAATRQHPPPRPRQHRQPRTTANTPVSPKSHITPGVPPQPQTATATGLPNTYAETGAVVASHEQLRSDLANKDHGDVT